MKIDTALYNNEKRHRYFIVDTILSRDLASAFWPLCVSYAPAYTVVFSFNTLKRFTTYLVTAELFVVSRLLASC